MVEQERFWGRTPPPPNEDVLTEVKLLKLLVPVCTQSLSKHLFGVFCPVLRLNLQHAG